MARVLRLRVVPALLLVATLGVGAAEREPVLPAAELVQPSLLAGPGYRVEPHATLRGLQAQFLIETEWGVLPADGVAQLAQRVDEMPMVQALHEDSIVAALGEAGIDRVAGPVQGLAALADDPLGAVARAPGGVLRMLGERVRRIGDQARRIGKRIDRAIFHEGSPRGAEPVQSDDSPWWDAPVDEAGRLLRSEAGHGRARREIALALGIDPWTGNPLLRQRLDALAWAIAGGRLTAERVVALASAGASEALSAMATVNQVTAQAGPENERRQLEARLEAWTDDAELRYALAWRSAYPPPRLIELLDRIEALAPNAGVESMLDAALVADSEAEARFVIDALALIEHNGDVPATGGALLPMGRIVGYLASDGEFLLPLAVDRLSWTSQVQRWFDHLEVAGHPRRTVLVAGSISPLAERALTRRGWSMRSHVRWPGSPPYRGPGESP